MALAVLWVACAAPAWAADAGRLAIVSPTSGEVTGSSVTVVVTVQGSAGVVRFTVAVDGTAAGADGLPVSGGGTATVLSVAPGGRTSLTLHDLGNGVHHLEISPVSPAGVTPATMDVTVRGSSAPATSRSPVVLVIGLVLFAAVWLLLRRRMRSVERRWTTSGDEGRGAGA